MAKDKMVNLHDGAAFDELFKMATTTDMPIDVKSFDDFVQNVFSLSYPNYDMNTWHIRLIAQKIDSMLADPNMDKNLLGVFPRYHLKSTILEIFSFLKTLISHKLHWQLFQ